MSDEDATTELTDQKARCLDCGWQGYADNGDWCPECGMDNVERLG